MNEKFNQVITAINEMNGWDDIYMSDGYDRDEEHFCIFERWDDLNKFVALAIDILQLDADSVDYDVERELETNFVFSDEYTTCDDCRNIIRTSPDSYGWQPYFYIGDGFIVCGDCVRANEGYVESYIGDKINNPKSAINGLLEEEQLKLLGFSKWNSDSYESGWYDGQNDNPEAIYDKLQTGDKEIVFFIDSVGQFDMHFSVWIR